MRTTGEVVAGDWAATERIERMRRIASLPSARAETPTKEFFFMDPPCPKTFLWDVPE
jgi:hypothetical protein